MLPGIAMAMHVFHVAGKATVQPIAQMIEAIGRSGGGDTGHVKSQFARSFFDLFFQRIHFAILSRPAFSLTLNPKNAIP